MFPSCGWKVFLLDYEVRAKLILKTLCSSHQSLILDNLMKIPMLKIFSLEFLNVILQIMHESKTYFFCFFPELVFSANYYKSAIPIPGLPGDVSLNHFFPYVCQSAEKASHARKKAIISLVPCKYSI